MVISEKQVADQLKALNIGFNPTKEQIEETLTYIDTIRVNQPNAYTKHKENIFDPYEKAIRGLEAQYGEFKRGIVLQTAVAEKTLQQIVDRSVQEGKNPNIDDVTREAAKQSVEGIKQGYTERMLPTFDMRIKAVKEKLAMGDDRAKKLLELLEAVLKNVTSTSVNALQAEILSGRTGVTVSKKGDPDGYFGPLTMNALEKIAGIKAEEAKVAVGVQSTAGKTVSNEAKQSSSLVSDLRIKAAAAGTTVSDAVSKAVSGSGAKSEAKTETPVSTPTLKWAPQNGFALKDGSKVRGMYVEEGRMWFIGAKGERQEVNTTLLSDGITAKKIEALNENAKKLASLASDAELLLQATANHARIANWPNPKSWEDKISEFGKMLQTLDISDEIQARRAIIKFIQATPPAKWDLAGEFADVFNYADNDTERHAKIYKYIRGSWYNLGASWAGFDGGSDMLSNRIASTELLKQNIGPKELEAFITQWMNGNWSNASDDAVSKAIVQSAKNAGGAFQYLATVYNNEKWLPNFVKSFKSSIKQLSEAYKDPKIDTELAKVIKTENEREAYKRESRNAKLMTLLGTTVLARHLKNKPQERTWNFELDTFASINGTGTLEISDSTAKYIRNDLWKDVAIEVAAIGLGAVTAGFGAAAIHGLAAARWTARAGEIARIGTRVAETGKLTLNGAGKVMTRVVGGGVGFEVGHGAVSGVARGKDFNEWYSTEAFLQSMAFAGAFEVAGKILKLAKVPGFDPTKTILEQKTLLAKYVWADALASLGVSYGISWKHGEDYTFQEALQAIAMAAFFRTAMTRAEGVPLLFQVKKTTTQGVMVEPVITEQVANTRTKLINLMTGENLNITSNIQVKRTKDGYRVIDRSNGRAESNFVSVDELMMSGFTKNADEAINTALLTHADPSKAFKVRSPAERKRGAKTSVLATENVAPEASITNKSAEEAPMNKSEKKAVADEEAAGKKKTDKEKQKSKEVTEVVNDPVEGKVEIKTGEDASMNKVDKDGKKTPLTPDEEAGVLVRNKDKGYLAKILSDEKQLYHVVDVLEPLYKSAKKGLAALTTEPIAKLDGKIRDIPYLVGTLYGIPASTFKWVVVKPTGLALKFTEKTIAVALHDISTPVDIGWNILSSIRNKDHHTFGHFLRSVIYADRRDKATYVKDTNSLWGIDYRRLNVLILLAMGATASSVYREEEWVVRGPVSQMKDAILLGGITTYLKSSEAYEWVNAPGMGESLKELKAKAKTSPQVQETSESTSITDIVKSAQDSLENSGKDGWKSPSELIQSTKDDYEAKR